MNENWLTIQEEFFDPRQAMCRACRRVFLRSDICQTICEVCDDDAPEPTDDGDQL